MTSQQPQFTRMAATHMKNLHLTGRHLFAASWMKISNGWSPAAHKLLINLGILYLTGCYRDASCIQLVADQNKFSSASNKPMINTERLAASQMQILQK